MVCSFFLINVKHIVDIGKLISLLKHTALDIQAQKQN